ncbi:MAG TPA: ATP-binding protein, partial [Caulobacteraceae bacterium]|nr:ATP-binding protein [Caulobacteraceae bacterium]
DEWRWMRCSTRPRFDSNGELLGYVGIAFDVTETHEAQEYLRLQERRQRFLLQLGDSLRETDDPKAIAALAERSLGRYLRVGRAGYGEVDEEAGTITVGESWSESALPTISGVYTLQSYGAGLMADLRRGRTVRVYDTATDPRTAEVVDAFQAEGVRARLSVPVVRAGRTRAVFFLHHTAPRVWTDEETALVEEAATRTWTEIERARALIEVRESEERFRSIANSAPILVWVTNADRKRAFVNQTYVEFMGGTYDEGLNRDWREYLHPDDWERILQEQVAGEGSLKPFSLEARYKRFDGQWRWLRSFSRPRFSPTGELLGFVGAAYDVTEERQVQADLEHINDLLAERVSQALAEKELAEAALIRAQKLEALGRLTGGVAHDFNNLLTVVVGALDMILKHPDDAAKRKRMAEAAMAAARRGEQLTHQLLAFSRRQALRPALCDVNALIGESEPLMRRAVGEAVQFETRLCEGEAIVKVDPAQFEAAVFNLLVNARDATPDGGRITIETAWRELEAGDVADVPAGRHVSVRITDTGQGMAPDVLARVFEPFYTTKPQGKGTGLGLSQVYGFAQQSGGGINIESEPGAGTSVTIFLPASAEALPLASQPPVGEAMRALNILLVEDDGEVAAIAEAMLRHLGHEVTRVSSAARALVRLRSDAAYELLLTDVVMPGGMDGVELAHRAVEMRPELKVLLTSGYAGEAVDETLVHAPWPFLRKPYSQAELVELLTAAMGAGAGRPQGPKPRKKSSSKA